MTEATPDLVGLTDVADILGCSRQNMKTHDQERFQLSCAYLPGKVFSMAPVQRLIVVS